MKHEHGTIQNYVIGFVLSLVFTLIPYWLVVNHKLHGTILFGTIMVFALLQAGIQLLFFLHLGRERKPRWQSGFLLVTAGGLFVVTVGTTWILYHLHENMTPTAAALALAEDEGIPQAGEVENCAGQPSEMHMVMISNDVAVPSHIDARVCDKIMFMNEGNQMLFIAFGPHDHHELYGGVTGLSLDKGESQTLVLSQTGTHSFHDHLRDKVAGDFTVNP